MPHNLDEHTRSVIVKVMALSVAILTSANLAAQRVVIPRLRQKLGNAIWDGPLLLRGCLTTMVWMLVSSALLTLPVILGGNVRGLVTMDGENNLLQPSIALPRYHSHDLTSSINFCEDDFVDSHWIAEPANTMSSLVSYCPLALWGLFGVPCQEWRCRKAGHIRFGVAYATLFCIGLGSTLLHALLTAGAQGGDELPMLWFMASLSFIALDVILQRSNINLSALISTILLGHEPGQAQKDGRWFLHWLLGGSAVVATAIYLLSRENFLPFYIMFVLYSVTATAGLIVICFFLKWNDDTQFRSSVLLPLAVCTGWTAIFSIVCWVCEMLYCAAARESESVILQWIFNRGIHAFWHCSSALLAWLLIQAMLAGQGLQRGWGEPQLQCSPLIGVPFVTFSKAATTTTTTTKARAAALVTTKQRSQQRKKQS
jgi:Ceramidase